MTTTRRSTLRMLSACAVAAIALTSTATPAEPAERGEIVRMSPFEVSASSIDFSNWIKVRSPNYVLYTDASLLAATEVVREFEMVRAAAQTFFRRPAQTRAPTMIVLPTADSDWRKFAYKGKVQWQVAAVGLPALVTDLLLVEYDWQQLGLSTAEGVHAGSIVCTLNLQQPWEDVVWLDQGLSSWFEAMEIGPDSVTFGRPSLRMAAVQRFGWLGWEKFFALTTHSPEFWRNGPGHEQLNAQSTAFVHYLLTRPEPGWDERLLQWVALNARTETVFKTVFGQDWKSWQQTMERHVAGGAHRVTTVAVAPEICDVVPERLALAAREMRELFVLAQILNQETSASKTALETLLARGVQTDSLRGLLAMACLKPGRIDAMLSELRKLVSSGNADATAYAMAAFVAFSQDVKAASLKTRIGVAKAQEMKAWCQRALELEPRNALANCMLATSAALAEEISPDTPALIEAIYRRIEGHVPTNDVLWPLAVAHWRLGQANEARGVAQALVDSPYCDKDARKIAAEVLKETAPRR